MIKSYIWSIPSRVFHFLFVLLILVEFLTGDEDRLLKYHAVLGYALLIVLIFRIIWGLVGPRFSKFKDFPLSINEAKEFLSNIFNKNQKHIGHNPLASFVMVGIFFVCFITILTGVLVFGIQEGKGVFSFLNNSFFKEMELFEEIHELFASLFIFLIVAHMGGILFDKLFHGKQKTLNSIFDGYKMTNKNESISLNIYQKIIFVLFSITFIIFVVFNLMEPNNMLVSSKYKPINYEKQNKLFVSECASCHTLYTPNLLPKHSWQLVMADLKNHFGDDASLANEDAKIILSFLEENSAETSTKKVSVKILNSLKNKDIIAVTDTVFWKNTHRNINKEVFKYEKIKSKANCKACHRNIEKGLI